MTLTGNWSYPTNIRFGAGRIAEIGGACMAAGISRPLFVTDRGLAEADITNRTLDLMEAEGLGRAMFAQVDPNPSDLNVFDGLRILREGGFDGIVAFGGGSGLDLGKTLAFMAGQTRPIWDFEDIGDWWTRADAQAILPVVAVPTTAGTGSEVGRASVITNTETCDKKVIFHPKMLPSVVIADPELTMSMPRHITIGTGLDALAHCIEAFSSPHYHPLSQGIALEGMRLVFDNLMTVSDDGGNVEARSHMLSASMMGATAFQKGLGAVHALSHPVGAHYGTHHGTTNAVFMPSVMRFNASVISDRFSRASGYLGIEGGFDGVVRRIEQMCTALDIPANLTELGVSNPNLDVLVPAAMKDPTMGGNPIVLSETDVRALYTALL